MQSRVMSSEEINDSQVTTKSNHSRLPLRLFQLFGFFLVFCLVFSVLSMYTIRHFGIEGVVTTVKSSIGSCYEGSNSFQQWMRPSLNLIHTMTDEELLWRTSLVSKRKKYPFDRVPKVAFMFLSKGPMPLAPLWEKFFKGHDGLYSVYLHTLPTFQEKFPSGSVFYQRQIPSQVAEWGRMSMCDAERRLIANALLDITNEWFLLLSESCIPLYNFSVVYNYVLKSKYSFMGAFDDPGPFGRGRYNINMAPEVNISQWRKGAQWFGINRNIAVSIVADTKYHPKFKEFCRPACYVDEHYFPTMLTIEAPSLLANRSITRVDWSRGGPHPATFGRSDITEEFFRKRIYWGSHCKYNNNNSSICDLFARKFAPNTLEPLMHLSSKVLGF